MTQFADDVASIGALAEPVRRELYLFVCAQPEPVSRDQAAGAIDVPVHKAKFHLDKLEAEGLLETEFARQSGRSGPGAGRPAKLYRRVNRDIAVSLPGREYELAGRLLADAVAASASTGAPVMEVLNDVSAAHGRTMGKELVAANGLPDSAAQALELACTTLAAHDYEPRVRDNRVELANCPFHTLASTHTEMVCGMNLALIGALADTIATDKLTCTLAPAPGRCCVVLEARQ